MLTDCYYNTIYVERDRLFPRAKNLYFTIVLFITKKILSIDYLSDSVNPVKRGRISPSVDINQSNYKSPTTTDVKVLESFAFFFFLYRLKNASSAQTSIY